MLIDKPGAMRALYVKIKCTVCHGTKLHSASGHHDPQKPFKWKECPYCDGDGLYLIEAGNAVIAEHIAALDPAVRDQILLHVQHLLTGSNQP